jgi:hypothetical protein
MTQQLPADYAFSTPSWMNNVGTNATIPPYHTDYVRVNPFSNTGTLTPSSGANAGPTHASATDALHYLSDGLRIYGDIKCQFVRRKDGAGGDNAFMSWLVMHSEPFAYDDLTVEWTFVTSQLEAPGAENLSLPPGQGALGTGTSLLSSQQTITGGVGMTFSPAGPMGIRYHTGGPTDIQNPTGWDGWIAGYRLQGDYPDLDSVSNWDIDDAVMAHVDGYWLYIYPSSYAKNADLTLKLFHTHAANQTGTGVTRRLVAQQEIPNGTLFLNLDAPITIKAITDNVAGSPTVQFSIFPFDGVETTMFQSTQPGTITTPAGSASVAADGTITDTHANKLTGQGTIAFGGSCDRIITIGQDSINVREGLASLEAYRTSTPTATRWRDEFDRSAIHNETAGLNNTLRITDQFGFEGGSLESLWAFGLNAATDSSDDVPPILQRTDNSVTTFTPNAVAYLTHDGTADTLSLGGRDYIFFRPSDRDDSHHRIIDFKPGSAIAAAQFFRFGLVARGSVAGGAFFRTAIACWIEVLTSGSAQTSFTVNLGYRTKMGGDADEYATYEKIATASYTTSPNLFDGAFHTLEFDCYIFPDAASEGAPVIYEVKLDGTNVTFTAESGSTVTILASDAVIDFASPYSAGRAEGFFFSSQNPQSAGWPDWQVRDFDQLTLTTAVSETSPDEQASIAVTGETPGATGTLEDILENDWPFAEETISPSWRFDFESMHTQGASRWSTVRRRYRFNKTTATESEIIALRSFWDSHNGNEIPFNWQPDVEEASMVARFSEDSLVIVERGPNIYDVTFGVEELVIP